MVSYLCGICEKTIDDDKESSILCNFCNSWIDPKCNHLNFLDFQRISGNNSDPWLCFKCISETFPFGNLNNQNFHSFIHNNPEMNGSSVGKYTNGNTILTLNPPLNLKLLFNQFNELTAESNNKNPENFLNCRNLDIDEIQKMKIEPNSLSLFHINCCSLNKNFEDLEYLLKPTNKAFDVTATESHAGGTLVYINNKLSYKVRQDLCIYKSSELESTFIEIINPKKTNITIGCIYRHPTMNLNEFNDNHLNILLQKISKEKKNVLLLGDFNVDLLKYDKQAGTNEFIDSLSSYMYLPYILHPTRVTSHSQIIIDNIFSNYVSKEAVSGNLTSTISDHLPQVFFIPSMLSDNLATKSNIFERSWKNFNQADLSWITLIKIGVTS